MYIKILLVKNDKAKIKDQNSRLGCALRYKDDYEDPKRLHAKTIK